jgi:pilus assembly protein CpaE
MTIRTLLLAPDAEAGLRLSARIGQRGNVTPPTTQYGGARELSHALLQGDLDIAVASLPSVTEQDLGLLESTLASRPNVSVILVANETSTGFLMRAMRAGIREVVPDDAGEEALCDAYRRQYERFVAVRGAARRGTVLAFMPGKGGSGATFLAANLACAIVASGQRVALIDVNVQFGDAALFVTERRATVDIGQVAREVERLDAPLLESSMLHVADNLWALPAPDTPERAVDVTPAAIERILSLARTHYDFVVLDAGRFMEPVAIRALDDADAVHVVMQSSLPSLNATRRVMSVLASLGYGREKLKVVLNREGRHDEIQVTEIEKVLGRELSMRVPNSYATATRSINHGEPMVRLAPRDPVSRVLLQWAAALVPQSENRSGWLRGLFGSRN